MHEYHVIKQKLAGQLAEARLIEVVTDTRLDDYGSVYSIFASDAARILIEWDGEDGLGSADIYEGDNTWRTLNATVPEGSDEQFADNLEALSQELSRYLEDV